MESAGRSVDCLLYLAQVVWMTGWLFIVWRVCWLAGLFDLCEFRLTGLRPVVGFVVSKVFSGFTLGFQCYDTGSCLTRLHHHGNTLQT